MLASGIMTIIYVRQECLICRRVRRILLFAKNIDTSTIGSVLHSHKYYIQMEAMTVKLYYCLGKNIKCGRSDHFLIV